MPPQPLRRSHGTRPFLPPRRHYGKCVVGDVGKPWTEYCEHGEAQHCAHMVQLKHDGAAMCCERCRLRRLGEWDNRPRDDMTMEQVVQAQGRVYSDEYYGPEG